MNILHMKYAVEVARLGSLSKAAETLLIAQPNISRSIKELEASLGITIFNRSPKGMMLTEDGEEFIRYARQILRRIDELELIYRQGAVKRQRFSVCAPYAHYASTAFAEFTALADKGMADMFYNEADTYITIDNVVEGNAALGIIRYDASFDKHFKGLLEEKRLNFELIGELPYILLMNKSHPLASSDTVSESELADFPEILCSEAQISSQPPSRLDATALTNQRIFLSGGGCIRDVIWENTNVYIRTAPMPAQLAGKMGFVQKKLTGTDYCKDLLIYRDGYRLTGLDNTFISVLCKARRACQI